jgi:hypothetical protein
MSYPTRRHPFTPLRIALVVCSILALAPRANAQTLSASSPPATAPLSNAHAHNDYLHDRPLLDALDQGFCSVEADVFLVEGELWVAHTKAELSSERTLRRLYLDPLRDRIVQNNSSVFGDGQPLTLLIDLKSDGEATYQALDKLLEEYREILTYSENGVEHTGPVIAIISGNRPVETVAADTTRYVGIDGRLSDLESESSVSLLPLISDNWRLHFGWQGVGEIPAAELEKLQQLVEQVHQRKRRIRFWATPDTEAAWRVLHQAGVDLINTDDLKGLSQFLQK